MDEVVEDGRLPDGCGAVGFEEVFQAVGPKGPEAHPQKTQNGSDADGSHGAMLAQES